MSPTDADRQLAFLEGDEHLLRLARLADVATALQHLIGLEEPLEQIVQLGAWASD